MLWIMFQDEGPARGETQQYTSVLVGEISSLLRPEYGVHGVEVKDEAGKGCFSQSVVESSMCHNNEFEFYSVGSAASQFLR